MVFSLSPSAKVTDIGNALPVSALTAVVSAWSEFNSRSTDTSPVVPSVRSSVMDTELPSMPLTSDPLNMTMPLHVAHVPDEQSLPHQPVSQSQWP